MTKYELMTQKVLDIEDDLTFVVSDNKDIWMDQKTIAVLLGTTVGNVSYHFNKKFEDGELFEEEKKLDLNNSKNTRSLLINPDSKKQPILYNFESILAVAFSVNSKRALEVHRQVKKTLATIFYTPN